MHTMIVGNSGTGKSIMAKCLADDAERRGYPVIVFDPTRSKGWPTTARKYADPGMFLDDASEFNGAYVFIDEAADVWAFDENDANELIYRGRHRGLLFYLIAQRSRMIKPNARNQCDKVYAFRQQIIDAKILADEYHVAMLGTCELVKLEGLMTDGIDVTKVRVDYNPNRFDIVVDGQQNAEVIELSERREESQNKLDNGDESEEN